MSEFILMLNNVIYIVFLIGVAIGIIGLCAIFIKLVIDLLLSRWE